MAPTIKDNQPLRAFSNRVKARLQREKTAAQKKRNNIPLLPKGKFPAQMPMPSIRKIVQKSVNDGRNWYFTKVSLGSRGRIFSRFR